MEQVITMPWNTQAGGQILQAGRNKRVTWTVCYEVNTASSSGPWGFGGISDLLILKGLRGRELSELVCLSLPQVPE